MFSTAHKPVLLTVVFRDDAEGVEIELNRPMMYGASGTGAGNVELMHLDQEYRATAAAVHERLERAGVLIASQE